MKSVKYYVSYVTMDTEAGANPFWHASLILSQQETESGPIEVVDAIGFYSQPSSTTDPIISVLKQILGFKIDLQDGHGILKREKMRDLDGNGLHGIHFQASATQFHNLKKLYTKRIRLEQEAIDELNHELLLRGEPQNGHTRFVEESSLAALEKRKPRLNPFHIQMDLTKEGFDSRASYGCKNYALDLLLEVGIIDKTLRDKIIGGAFKSAFPRFSGLPSEPVRLVSTGEPQQEISTHSRRVYYNRRWGDNHLFWASGIKPINLTQDEQKPSKVPQITNDIIYPKIKDLLNRVRVTENQLRHKITELEDTKHHAARRNELKHQLERVMKLYDLFSNSYENQLKPCFASKCLQAETTLDVANLSLTPNRVNHAFLFRAYSSIAVRNALLSLLGLIIAATCVSGAIGAILVTTASLFATHQVYTFFKEDSRFATMRANYLAFQHANRHINHHAHDLSSETPRLV